MPEAAQSKLNGPSRFPWVDVAMVLLLAGLGTAGVVLGLVYQQQYRLNRALAGALDRGDEKRSIELLQQGASVAVVSPEGRTCVGLGARLPSPVLLREALKRGGSPKWNAASREHPLIMAVRTGRPDNVRLLMQHGGNVNGTGKEGATVLMFATGSPRSAALTRELLEWKPDLDAVDAQGRTALMQAVSNASPECVELLLRAGADPARRDIKGQTALDRARRRERECRLAARQHSGFRKKAVDYRRIVAAFSTVKAPSGPGG